MKKRRKKSRPTKDFQGQNTSNLLSDPQQLPREVEGDCNSKVMATSDCRVDDESTMEGYDTEGYRQLQSSNESNLNDVIDTTDDKLPTSPDKCMPLGSNDSATKKRKEPRSKPKPKPGEPTKSRKRGRPPKIRISSAEKTECVPLVEQVDQETEAEERCKKQCLSWSLEEQARNFLISEANSYIEWSDNRRQSAVETSVGTDSERSSPKDSDLQHRSPSNKLSENFGTFQQIKQNSFVQCTTKDKENNLTRIDVNAGNVIEIVCGPNRGLMYLSRLSLATGERCKTKCIHFNDRWWTPSEFQMTSGRGAAKDWKRTIRHGDKCLKALLESGTLKLNLCNKNACFCESCCRGYHPANDDLTKMPSLTPMTVKESDDKSFPHEGEKKSKKRDKDSRLSKQRRARPAAEQKILDVEGYRGLKEFTSYTDEFNQGLESSPPPLHLLRNEVPPPFCQPTNSINDSSKGDSFQVFDEAFYKPKQLKDKHKSHYKGQPFENLCDLSFKSVINNQNISGLAEIYSRQPPITDQTQLADENNNNRFWKEESMKTSNNPKSMLRAVVEELKTKKKKSLSSHSGRQQMSGRKSQSSDDSAMDLSLHEPLKKLSKRVDASMDFQKASPSSPSSPSTFSFPSTPTSHVYGFNSSLFPQNYPHFNFPFYSPYIFMGFPLHPIISHHPSLSGSGFQTHFPASTYSFPFEFAKHHDVNPLLNKESTTSRESLNLEFSSKTACLPTYSEIDEEKFKAEDKFSSKTEKVVKNFRADSPGRIKSSHFLKSQDDNREVINALDFSLKSSKDLDAEESGHLEVLDLSTNSHIR